jgi:hypothetical protein
MFAIRIAQQKQPSLAELRRWIAAGKPEGLSIAALPRVLLRSHTKKQSTFSAPTLYG